MDDTRPSTQHYILGIMVSSGEISKHASAKIIQFSQKRQAKRFSQALRVPKVQYDLPVWGIISHPKIHLQPHNISIQNAVLETGKQRQRDRHGDRDTEATIATENAIVP